MSSFLACIHERYYVKTYSRFTYKHTKRLLTAAYVQEVVGGFSNGLFGGLHLIDEE